MLPASYLPSKPTKDLETFDNAAPDAAKAVSSSSSRTPCRHGSGGEMPARCDPTHE